MYVVLLLVVEEFRKKIGENINFSDTDTRIDQSHTSFLNYFRAKTAILLRIRRITYQFYQD